MENNSLSSGTHDNLVDFAEDMRLLNDESGDILNNEGDESIGEEESDGEVKPQKIVKKQEGKEEKDEVDEEDEKGATEDKEGDKENNEDKEPEPIKHGRPTVQTIKAKYPDFFKDFPDMRHMLFREGEFTSVFPTVEEAKEAREKVDDFDNLTSLFTSNKQSDFQGFLGGLAEDPKVLNSVASNFLPSLYNTNRDLYFSVTTPIAEALVRNAYARAGNDENLKNAALVLAQWAFGDQKFATGEKQSDPVKVDKASDPQLEQERNQFYQERYADARTYVNTNGFNRIRADIKRDLDPNDVFNEFTTNLILKQIEEEIGQELEKDSRHMATMNSLWKQAQKAGFAGNWKDRILTTYLSRARAIMPAIRARVRSAALQGEQKKSSKIAEIANRSGDRVEIHGQSSGKPGKPSNGVIDSKKVDWSKTSDLDMLNDRVTYKK